MDKHTPGPWAAHHHKRTNTYTIHEAGKDWECSQVAHVGDCTNDEANARLIAAAPDLLGALKDLILLAEVAMREAGDFMVDDELIDARTAIAKATGELSSLDKLG